MPGTDLRVLGWSESDPDTHRNRRGLERLVENRGDPGGDEAGGVKIVRTATQH